MNNYSSSGFGLLPPVVKNLLILNGLFFLAYLSVGQVYHLDMNDALGLMHGGFLHLFSNMFALWMFGKEIEYIWGPRRFLIYFFVTGIGAAIIHYLVIYYQVQPTLNAIQQYIAKPDPAGFKEFLESGYFQVPTYEFQNYYKVFIDKYNEMLSTNAQQAVFSSIEFMTHYKTVYLSAPVVVGASGAVFGILLAFGMMFPDQILYIYFALPMKAKYFVFLYGAFELYAGISNRTGDNIAHFAHLGGMVFGLLLILYWKNNKTFYKKG